MDRCVALVSMTIAAGVLVAGCISSQLEPASLDRSVSEIAPLPEAYRYLCPGATGKPADLPCVTLIARDDAFLTEPYVALDPNDPSRAAVGVNLGFPRREIASGAAAKERPMMRVGMFFTEDGGASWRETIAPPPEYPERSGLPAPVPFDADPAFVFDSDGRVHATGLVHRFSPPEVVAALSGVLPHGDARVFYARSDDLGRSWQPSIALSPEAPGHQDRNWITYDDAKNALYVVWHNTGRELLEDPLGPSARGLERVTTEIAWSLDGGATWRNWKEPQFLACYLPARPLILGSEVLVSCGVAYEGQPPRIAVYTFDPETGAAQRRSHIAIPADDSSAIVHFLHRFESGRLVAYAVDLAAVQGRGAAETFVAFSEDAGASWTDAVRLTETTGGAWGYAHAWWGEMDGRGGLHMLLELRKAPVAGAERLEEGELHHVVFDDAGTVVHDVRIDSPTTDPRVCHCVANHFYGIGWSQGSGLLAFTLDGAIGVAGGTLEDAPRQPL